MLTLLFLIHQWFYSNPRRHSSHKTYLTEQNRTAFTCKSTEDSCGAATASQKKFAPSLCTGDVALITVCKVSATIVVAGVLPSQEHFKKLEMSIDDKFHAAVRVIHSLPKDGPYQPSNSTKLKFYGLYKQATEGKNNQTKPAFWDVIGRAKWDAWNKLGDMSKDDAMNQYVDCLKEIVETMSFNGDVEGFLDSIGPFYEFVSLQGGEMHEQLKEKIEEFSSSNSSAANSIANSVANSIPNSKENSPLKTLLQEFTGEQEEKERALVIVETSSATYESGHHVKSHSSENGEAYKMANGDGDGDDAVITPPPAPRHSYSHQNGFVKHAEPETDEVLTVSTSYNVSCKEDLERDAEDEDSKGHRKVKVTSSIETVTSNATSGTESEKYYSGDSEPEMDEKFATYLRSINNSYPSTSAAALAQQQQHLAHSSSDGSYGSKKSVGSPMKKSFKDRISPKNSFSSMAPADIATQQTIERINRDVDHILARLRILEAAYAANAEGAVRGPSSSSQAGRKRRIFGDLSPQAIAFIVMWPFACQFLLKLVRWWWRRRRNLRSLTN